MLIDATDAVQHKYWKYYDPGSFMNVSQNEIRRWSKLIPKFYCKADTIIGKIIDHYNENITIVIVSDHGFGPMNISKLEAERITGIKASPREVSILKILGFADIFEAFTVSQWSYFTLKKDNNSSIDFLDRLKDALEKIKESSTGKNIFSVKKIDYKTLQIGPGYYTEEHRDIVIDGNIFKSNDIFRYSVSEISGDHRPEGILIASGPQLKQNYQVNGASVLDVTPTILYLMGLPIPKHISGKILKDGIDSNYLENEPVKTSDFDLHLFKHDTVIDGINKSDLKKRLRDLGYIE